MTSKTTLVFVIFLSLFLSSIVESRINTVRTQKLAKERARKMKGKIIPKYKKYPTPAPQPQPVKIKRRRADDDDDDDGDDSEDVSYSYDRCDNGHTPDDLSDCTGASTTNSTCCMFTYGVDTGCVLIGFKYLGTKTIGDMTVTCAQKFLNIAFWQSLILALSLFAL